MGLEPSTRPWLFARMIGSFAIMSIVALTIVLFAAAVIGTAVYLAITVAFAVVRGYVLSFGGGVPGGELWGCGYRTPDRSRW